MNYENYSLVSNATRLTCNVSTSLNETRIVSSSMYLYEECRLFNSFLVIKIDLPCKCDTKRTQHFYVILSSNANAIMKVDGNSHCPFCKSKLKVSYHAHRLSSMLRLWILSFTFSTLSFTCLQKIPTNYIKFFCSFLIIFQIS